MNTESLAGLLGAQSVDGFFDTYWEKKHLLLQQRSPSIYAHLLSINDVERILLTTREPEFGLFKNGQEVPAKSVLHTYYWKDEIYRTVDFDRFYQEFLGGTTLILEALHHKVPSVASLCQGLSKTFGSAVQANVYLTPPHSQGFSSHFDTHDVFVLQIAGLKRWRLHHSPMLLPLRKQKYSSGSMGIIDDCFAEFDLTPGDMLYLPRGMGHEAAASDGVSCHITIGVMSYTIADYITDLVSEIAAHVPAYRRGLRRQDSQETGHGLHAQRDCKELLGAINKAIDSGGHNDAIFNKHATEQSDLLPGRLSSIAACAKLEAATKLVVNARQGFSLSLDGENLCLKGRSKQMLFRREAAPELCYIAAQSQPFTLGEIEGVLSDHDRNSLIADIVKEGFLYIID